jgi:hypothetical protein
MQLKLIQPSSLNETDLSRCVELVAQGGAVRPDDAAQGCPAEGRECRLITTCKETNLVSLKKTRFETHRNSSSKPCPNQAELLFF